MGSLPYNLDPNKGPVGKFFSGLSLIELEKVEWGPVVHLYSPRSVEISNGQYKDNPVEVSRPTYRFFRKR